MKQFISLFLFCLLIGPFQTFAQGHLKIAPVGGNKKASISEQIGICNISLHYDRPGVKGREGKIWGTSVAYYGYDDLGTSKAAPWRAGANENTTISFTHNVKIEGQDLPAGTYGLFMALEESKTTVIFSNNSTSWGSYFYDAADDALRVVVNNENLEKSVEWLQFTFSNQTENSAVVALEWEKRRIPFKIEVDIHAAQIASFKKELRSGLGFEWQSYAQAAMYCATNKVELPQALEWAETAVSSPFLGEKNFQTLSCKAAVLNALNRSAEADESMKEALPLGTELEVHTYAKTLLSQKRAKVAFDAFKLNYEKHPDSFTTLVGMGRGHSALGEYGKALDFLKKALPKAPNPMNQTNVENMIKKLEQKQDIN
jgi:hypothetical protein